MGNLTATVFTNIIGIVQSLFACLLGIDGGIFYCINNRVARAISQLILGALNGAMRATLTGVVLSS